VEGEPKYLNSPETDIFHKGRQLYNLHQAKGPIRKEESVILVEGYFDVLRLVLAGVEHVVAPLGTALTPDQGALLRRYTKTATLLYDSDRAGLQATFRAGDELLRHEIRVRVATLPPGDDPDTLVAKGGVEALDQVLGDAVDLLERKIQLMERKGYFEGFEHRRDAVDRLLPTIRAAADPITRELYLSLASERTKISKEVLESELASGRGTSRGLTGTSAGPGSGGAPSDQTSAPNGVSRPSRVRSNPESKLVAALIAGPEWIEHARQEIAPSLFASSKLREVFEALLRDEDELSGQLPAGLSDEAAAVWSRLREVSQEWSQGELGKIYDSASQILRARPQYREMDGLTDPGEKRRRRAELRAEFPAADAWYDYQKAAQREVRRVRGPRGA
jgi:DNA primase